jgi:short-subunit dehydrogenase
MVTISSILAHLAPAHLADYAASKAAVSSLHHTLTNEFRQYGQSHKVKTILVEVGQMATDLFEKAETPWYAQFVGPTLEVTDVAKEIMRLLDKGQGGVIRMPAYTQMMVWYGVLPGSVQRFVRWFSGIDAAFMESRRANELPKVPIKE